MKKTLKTLLMLALVLPIAFMMTGCRDDDNSGTRPANGTWRETTAVIQERARTQARNHISSRQTNIAMFNGYWCDETEEWVPDYDAVYDIEIILEHFDGLDWFFTQYPTAAAFINDWNPTNTDAEAFWTGLENAMTTDNAVWATENAIFATINGNQIKIDLGFSSELPDLILTYKMNGTAMNLQNIESTIHTWVTTNIPEENADETEEIIAELVELFSNLQITYANNLITLVATNPEDPTDTETIILEHVS